MLKRILASKGVDVTYPKDVLQQAYKGSLIDDEQIWIDMLRDRNLTSHTYNEELADQIFRNLYIYYPVLYKALDQLRIDYL